MELRIEIADYDARSGIRLSWDDNAWIALDDLEGEAVLLRANPDGLRTLARHLLTMAQEDAPTGSHLHLDEHNGLETGSIELIIERTSDTPALDETN